MKKRTPEQMELQVAHTLQMLQAAIVLASGKEFSRGQLGSWSFKNVLLACAELGIEVRVWPTHPREWQ